MRCTFPLIENVTSFLITTLSKNLGLNAACSSQQEHFIRRWKSLSWKACLVKFLYGCHFRSWDMVLWIVQCGRLGLFLLKLRFLWFCEHFFPNIGNVLSWSFSTLVYLKLSIQIEACSIFKIFLYITINHWFTRRSLLEIYSYDLIIFHTLIPWHNKNKLLLCKLCKLSRKML